MFKKILLAACIVGIGLSSAYADEVLSSREESIIRMGAHTANGNLPALKNDFILALDSGMSINEINEVLVQMYAYTGFPRSLNAINSFMALIDERKAQGINDPQGKESREIPADLNKDDFGANMRAQLRGVKEIPAPSGYQVFAPIIDTYLKEHLFCDIFYRDVLTPAERELATIGALAATPQAQGQLRFHIGGALNTGNSSDKLHEYVNVVKNHVGENEAKIAENVLNEVLKSKQQN